MARTWTKEQKAALSAKFKGRKNPWNAARNRQCLADFYLPVENKFQEIKGFVSADAQQKHETLASHFGCELEVLGQAELFGLGVLTAKGKVVVPHVR